MVAYTQRSFSVAALLYVAVFLSASARRTRFFANALGAWLERRRRARLALEQLSAMSERELRDIGISHSDIDGVAAEPLRRYPTFRVD